MANHITSPSSRRAASTNSAVFNLAPSSSSSSSLADLPRDEDDDDDDDDAPLPFPAVLPRSDFLAPAFHPAAYLSALPHRHQTLEDLRADLRDRSATISAELLELVNANYTAFLSLGSELRGGDDKVEDVKVALLGFRRAVEDVKARVAARRVETQRLNEDLRAVRAGADRGRAMIDVSERLTSLEEGLALDGLPERNGHAVWAVDDSDASDQEEEEAKDKADGLLGSPPAKLSALAKDCSQAATLASRLDQDHPFVIRLDERLTRCRNTLLLDLGNALKEAKAAGAKGQDRVMKYLAVYRIMDAHKEAVKVLRRG